jgi:HK97 family phage major capsid protein
MRTIEEITSAMTALVDGAAGRSLTDDEVTQYEALEQELVNVKRDNEIRARNTAYNVTRIPAGFPAPARQRAENYLDGIRSYLLTGNVNADLRPSNAQSEGVPAEGGYLVPDEFRVKLVEKLKAYGGIGGVAERYTTGNGNPTEWPTIDDTGNVGEIVQEGNTFSAGADLAFGSNALGSYSYMAGGGSSTPLRVARELLQDSAFDIEGLLTRLLGTRIGRIQASHWVTGTGVNQPLGLVTGRTAVQTAATTGGITYLDLVTWIHSVDPAYRASARWAWNDATMKQVELITDSNGDPIFRGWGANLALGLNESTVMGYPVTIDQAFVNFSNADSTALCGAFGDLKQGYVIRDVQSVELLVNPYSRMANRQVEFSAWARADGTQQDTAAYVVLSGKS